MVGPGRKYAFIGLLPLMLAMPLMYWPRVIDGDTQPWVAIGAIVAFVAYWPARRQQGLSEALLITSVAFAAALAYLIRGPEPQALLRYSALLLTFVALWFVGQREQGRLIPHAVRATVVLWFVIGLYEVIAVRVGLPTDFFGRFVAGRSGVPSLTAEPSFYGSISVIQIMYLRTERDPRNGKYMALAAASVLFSGSMLSMLLLLFPILHLPLRWKFGAGVGLMLVMLFGYDLSQSGFFLRLQHLDFASAGIDLISQDASTSLRFGHLHFTLADHFIDSLLFQGSIDFEREYNQFAMGLYLANGSDFILTWAGELIFRSGPLGLVLLLLVFRHAYYTAPTSPRRFEKLAFMAVCLLNPINFANPFFLFYVIKRDRRA